MTIRAYVLIQTEVGQAADVVAAVRSIPGVVEADDVTGNYDVIARAEADSLDELGRTVLTKVQRLEGITRSSTCLVVELG
ncbi:MAG TPA: Lrp/AsnC ligand binding domain-containing protein [Acidimicrobiales bacterium]|nr:Lrp/AsnC ligand binding domain-containing protein [Acidimicrobiales bacterium]